MRMHDIRGQHAIYGVYNWVKAIEIARELEIHGGMALPRRQLVDFESQHPYEDRPGRCISFTTHPRYPKIFGCSNRQKDFETSWTPES